MPLAVYTNLGGLAVPCTLGLQFRKRTCQFTRLWETLWHNRNLRTHAVRLCTFMDTGSGEEPIAVYANMGGRMVPCTLGL